MPSTLLIGEQALITICNSLSHFLFAVFYFLHHHIQNQHWDLLKRVQKFLFAELLFSFFSLFVPIVSTVKWYKKHIQGTYHDRT